MGNSQNVPPVPPPPAPLSNGLSIAGSASSQSNSAANNKSIPAPPFCTKGRLPMRASTKIQGQGRKTSLKPYHWLKLTRAIQGSLWADAQKPEEASKYVIKYNYTISLLIHSYDLLLCEHEVV